ncbi:MAG TPA: hypothetical protein VF592_02595 [Sphingomonas sp.]|jgi:hypothetical protein|uniref:hypothetical protein n=1 Tax=Sphingomonas sp. TaxID=28214 RepID=UPI002ED8E260
MRRPVLLLALFGLAACDRPQEGTSVSIDDGGGNVLGAVDGRTGEVKIDVPGFQGSLKLPRFKLDADDVDLNGVKLYPGSTIDGIDIRGDEKGAGGGEEGVRLSFTSPAAAATVRDWLGERLKEAGFTVTPSGEGLSGTTDDGKPFRLEMRPGDAAASTGVIVLGG